MDFNKLDLLSYQILTLRTKFSKITKHMPKLKHVNCPIDFNETSHMLKSVLLHWDLRA